MKNLESIQTAIREVRDFLHGKTFVRTDRAIPSYLGLIPLIYLRYHFPSAWRKARDVDAYILRTLLTGSFSGTPDTVIDRLTRYFSEKQEFVLRDVYGIIRDEGRSLEVNKDSILSLHYGSKGIHLIFNLWYKQFSYQPAYEGSLPQVDHIFPQSLLRTVKVMNPETGRQSLLKYYSDSRDQIANCMLLTAEENGAGGKSDTPPREWFADKTDDYLDMHLIPKDRSLWRLERFEDFIEERKLLIVDKFSYMIHSEE